MPYYDYQCRQCGRKQSLFFKSYAAYDDAVPQCKACGSEEMKRVIGRVAVAKSEDARMDALADEAALPGLDENDPKSIGRFMRKMSTEMGEDLGDEFGEVVDRLEKGQAPDDIEKEMPDLANDAGGGSLGGDL